MSAEGRNLGRISTLVEETSYGTTEPLSDGNKIEQDSLAI
jgi:hypothetical protein